MDAFTLAPLLELSPLGMLQDLGRKQQFRVRSLSFKQILVRPDLDERPFFPVVDHCHQRVPPVPPRTRPPHPHPHHVLSKKHWISRLYKSAHAFPGKMEPKPTP